jgi:hypothetical protein
MVYLHFGTISAGAKRCDDIHSYAMVWTQEMIREIGMKVKRQHILHPVNLWCRFGGHARWCFKLYERWLWQPFIDACFPTLNTRQKGSDETMNPSCAYCNQQFAKNERAITVCSGEQMACYSASAAVLPLWVCNIRVRWISNNRVPGGNRMFCPRCHSKGNNLGEPDTLFNETQIVHR